jgi:ureidoglycolate lyase
MELTIEELTPSAFASYGEVISQPERQCDAAGPGWQWWGENAFMPAGAQPYAIGYLQLQPAELVFDWAERHMHTVEMLIPSGGDCLVYVAPPAFPAQPGRLPPLEAFKVFRVPQGKGVLLHEGVWHGAPLALDQPLSVVVLLQAHTAKEDGYVVRFADRPVFITWSR